MIQAYYKFIETILPFEWAGFTFMKNALLAAVLISPLFGILGTMVVGRRLVFFSDVLGHCALTGIALGVVLGISAPFWPMLIFVVLLAIAVNTFKRITGSSSDTTLGVFFAFVVSVGVVILSRGGGFVKYTSFLIGDILTVSVQQIQCLAVISAVILVFWLIFGNNLVLISVNPVLARSRGIKVFLLETAFMVLLAVVVAVAIRWVGILIINSLLVLPAATARILSRNMRNYTLISIGVSFISAVTGLIVSYYWGTATGATIVLFCVFFYILAVIRTILTKRR